MPTLTSDQWTLETEDYIEVFAANDSTTANLTVETLTLKVRG